MEYIILDVAIALLLVLFVARGARKGLVLTLSALAVLIVATVGAGICADTFSPALAEKLEPGIYSALEESLTADPESGEATEGAEQEQFSFMGIHFDFAADIYSDIFDSGEDAKLEAIEAAAKFFAAVIAKCGIAVAAFVVLTIVLKLVFRGIDLVAKLPLLKQINKLGGMAAGLITAAVLIFALIAVVGMFDGVIPGDAAEKTYLYRFFSSINPVAKLLGI